MEKILLNIRAIATSEMQANSFVIVMKEENGHRQLPVVIGAFEAQAIAVAIEGISQKRPLTHDLFYNFLKKLGANLTEVIISDLKEGVFYATIYCKSPAGNTLKIDARTSDAIALAVRFKCPIYTYPYIMDEAGIIFEPMSEKGIVKAKPSSPKKKSLSTVSTERLQELLEKALAKEDYERAAEIRDEMNRR